jgi:hypothetical protein
LYAAAQDFPTTAPVAASKQHALILSVPPSTPTTRVRFPFNEELNDSEDVLARSETTANANEMIDRQRLAETIFLILSFSSWVLVLYYQIRDQRTVT